jgi:hypothetical protein
MRYGDSSYDIKHRMPLEDAEELVFGIKKGGLKTEYVVGQQRGEFGCYGHYYTDEIEALTAFVARYVRLKRWAVEPPRCSNLRYTDAYDECTKVATHVLIARPIIDRETREQEIDTDPVCQTCGEGYARRPSQRAVLVPIS